MDQGGRRRSHVHSVGDELLEQFGRHVFVIEGQRVNTLRRPPQRVQVVVCTDHDIGGHLRGRVILAGGQYPQRLAERDRRLVGHPGQLPTADHGHHRHLVLLSSAGRRARVTWRSQYVVMAMISRFTRGDLHGYACPG
jgi:hypothetical protein